jgi:hypothetical protein
MSIKSIPAIFAISIEPQYLVSRRQVETFALAGNPAWSNSYPKWYAYSVDLNCLAQTPAAPKINRNIFDGD